MRLLFLWLFLCKDFSILNYPVKFSEIFPSFIHSFVFKVTKVFIDIVSDVMLAIFIEMVDLLTYKFLCAFLGTILLIQLFGFHPLCLAFI